MESRAFTRMNPTVMQFPTTHYAFGRSARKERFFTSGRTNRWLALSSPGSLLCPSCFQLSSKVEMERPRRTWRMRGPMPRVCFKIQQWHSLCPSFRKMLLMQGRAEDCLQPPDKDNLAWQPGGLALKLRGNGQLRHCSPLLSTGCWTAHSLGCVNQDHYGLHNPPKQTQNKWPDLCLDITQSCWLDLPWQCTSVARSCSETHTNTAIKDAGLGIVLWKGKAMQCLIPNPSVKSALA